MLLSEYESRINRGALHFRSSRLDAVIRAINSYLRRGSANGLEEIEKAVAIWKSKDPREYADRGEPVEAELAEAIRLEGVQWGWGHGRVRIVDRTSHPRYEPGLWNDHGRVQLSTNCYAYACNDPHNHAYNDKPQPGMHLGVRNNRMTNEAVRLAVMQDDMNRNHMRTQRLIPLIRLRAEIAADAPIDVVNVPGYYLIALVVAQGRDYHWYRQDDSGYWSHKPGHTQATDRDASGRLIVDPRECDLGIYSFTNFYYAPRGGVRTASLGDWYNPNWHY